MPPSTILTTLSIMNGFTLLFETINISFEYNESEKV